MAAADGVYTVHTADDGSLPCSTEREALEMLQTHVDFSMDQYIDKIQPLTFRTTFVNVSVDEGRAWRDFNRAVALTAEHQHAMNALSSLLESAIRQLNSHHGVFVRLSTRSPKDAIDKLPDKAISAMAEHARAMLAARGSRQDVGMLDDNDKLIIARRAFFQCMRVHSAQEALELIMNSSRAISDLKRALDYADKIPYCMKLIVREFVDLPLHGEFRGFVCNGQLTALSQYYTDCFFSELQGRESQIVACVHPLANQVISAINRSSFVVDFVVFDDGRAQVIELNPFGVTTGACLFNWKTELRLLENGPFELRIVKEKNNSHARAQNSAWAHLLDAALSNVQSDSKSEKHCALQ